MGLNVKRSFNINKDNRLELQDKISKMSFGNSNIRELLDSFNIIDKEIYNKITSVHTIDSIFNEKDKKLMVIQFNNYIKEIRNIHKKYLIKINWDTIKKINIDFDNPEDGPMKKKALDQYKNYEPNFLEKIFKFLQGTKKSKLLKKIEDGALKDLEIFNSYKSLKDFSENIINGNINAYFIAVDELNPFEDIIGYGSELIFGCNNSKAIEIEFKVNSKNIVPEYQLSLDESQELLKEKMETTSYYDIVEDYVFSSTLKIAKQTMEILPVEKVVIHAVDNLIDNYTGKYNDIVILSAVFDRRTMDRISLQNVESEFAIDNFICNVSQQKITGFKSVQKITQY